ncbi:Mut7-C RNAse domain-containing protein [Nocardia sp. CDC153]|uniref:Mut7-C RNAse domain-containing protein n=1 Tax=Nocardia sp. CDC153 TaxID=3112167 RepID=UPI002DBDDA65|nr:Mut7-C RNAse domain-containing protein [Nocardia sp. CDC153]MEC3956778.1 Mut7-C RNAse domain-containing protein [Nocardia sp. CDC153]
MNPGEITVEFAPELRVFVGQRDGAHIRIDGTSTLGHVVESLGVPLTEVGGLSVNGEAVAAGHIPAGGEQVAVAAVTRPQPSAEPLRFLLDIHLGTLARRMRLLGIDAAYENPDIGDAALAARSAAESRVLLSRDRGLLRRREIYSGAYVYSHHPAEQLDDILSRFAPRLDPWTRCTSCNGVLRAAEREAVRAHLPGNTGRSYDSFAQCVDCGQTYWKGAHHARLDAIVADALAKFA